MEEKKKEYSQVEARIRMVQRELDEVENYLFNNHYSEEGAEKLYLLQKELSELYDRLSFAKGPTYSNGVLDLYLDEEANKIGKVCEHYKIALAGEKKFIGHVRVTYDDMCDNFLGNIGYELNKKFRGNGYMLQALEILKRPMLESGLERPIITVDPHNGASVRTIEKFGGKKIFQDEGHKWYDSYEVDLREENHRSK